MTCRGGCNVGRPHQAQGRRMAFSSTFYETKLLEVSKIFQANTRKVSKPPLPGVHLSRGGETVKMRTCVPQIQANTLRQQFEANLALGF